MGWFEVEAGEVRGLVSAQPRALRGPSPPSPGMFFRAGFTREACPARRSRVSPEMRERNIFVYRPGWCLGRDSPLSVQASLPALAESVKRSSWGSVLFQNS